MSGIDDFNTDGDTYLNIFESVGDDVIAAVGTYFNEAGVNYTVEISVNDNLVYTQTGVSPYYGYHTITLDNYVSIKEGDIFSVMIKSNAVPFGRGARVHFEEGTSFTYENNT